MAREEQRAKFMELYSDVEVTFRNYYKYVFYYEGVTKEGNKIVVGCGGDADAIYREEVSNNATFTIGALMPEEGRVYDSEGNQTMYFWDY